MKYAFKLIIDSDKAREYWEDGIVLESEITAPSNKPPKPEEVVQESLDHVFNLDGNTKENIIVKEVFTDAIRNGNEFKVKFDLHNSSSK